MHALGIVGWGLILLGFWYFVGAVIAAATAIFFTVILIIAGILRLINGPPAKFMYPRLPVRGWDPKKTRYSDNGLPYKID